MLHLPMCAALPPPKGAGPLAALVIRSKHSLVQNPEWVGNLRQVTLHPPSPVCRPPCPPPPHTYLAEGHQVHVQAGLQAMVLLHHVALRKERRQ